MKKNSKKVTLYSNEITEEKIEDARQYLLEENGEEPTDSELWHCVYAEEDLDWDVFESEYKKYFNTNNFVAMADLGRWNGRFESGKIFTKGWDSFRNIIKDYDNIEIIDNNGHLEVVGHHHDGTDYIELRELTRKGDEYAMGYHWDKTEYEDAKSVWNNFHSRLPRLFERMGA